MVLFGMDDTKVTFLSVKIDKEMLDYRKVQHLNWLSFI